MYSVNRIYRYSAALYTTEFEGIKPLICYLTRFPHHPIMYPSGLDSTKPPLKLSRSLPRQIQLPEYIKLSHCFLSWWRRPRLQRQTRNFLCHHLYFCSCRPLFNQKLNQPLQPIQKNLRYTPSTWTPK